ncbi:MAG: TIGR04141 family sporadically distributed protein [Rickettsiales bacterium]|jgi:uncharacterized protein (TIGR04141 family)|nr:TIGR04141 family sporadically distributed protein [Rickettsiales bacterium]
MAKSNKITVYYIKDGLDNDSILEKGVSRLELNDGILYYNPKRIINPDWVDGFFNSNNNLRKIFKVASCQALFIKSVIIDKNERKFAISFGSGRFLLNEPVFVPNFGLKVVLNMIDEKNIKKIDTHNISSMPKHKSEQVAKVGGIREFSINYETDILMGITGGIDKDKNLSTIFGSNITGRDSLSANVKFDCKNIDIFLKEIYKYYNSDEYKKNGFAWIDNINRILPKDDLFEKLNGKLNGELKDIKNKTDKIWIDVPEIIKWEDIKGFYYKDKNDLKDDLNLLDLDGELSIEKLKHLNVHTLGCNKDEVIHKWSALKCLYAEIEFNDNIYIFINLCWYKVDSNFKKIINDNFNKILKKQSPIIDWPNFDGKNEKEYNINLSKKIKGSMCLDANNIHYGGGHSQIEFCDVFDIDCKNIIHVKKYAGSSVLSHLFNQGYASAELLKNDKEFKLKAAEKIQKQNPNFLFDDSADYNIIFVILNSKEPEKANNLPFFSKITLNHIVSTINNMKGYNSFVKIISTNI